MNELKNYIETHYKDESDAFKYGYTLGAYNMLFNLVRLKHPELIEQNSFLKWED